MTTADIRYLIQLRLDAEAEIVKNRHERGILSSSWSSGYIVALTQVLEDLTQFEELNNGS